MAVTAKPKPAPEPKVDPLDGMLDFIEVPREWIERNGWPQSYRDLDALAGAGMEGFKRHRARRGDIVARSYANGPHIAFFREGDNDKSLLYAQCWRVE